MKVLNVFGVVGLVMAMVLGAGVCAADTAADVTAVEKNLGETAKQMHELLPGIELLLDPAKRAEIGPKLIPILDRLSKGFDELATLQPERKDEFAPVLMQYLMLRSVLGEKASEDRLRELAESKNPAEALLAKGEQLEGQWMLAANDATAQGKIVDELAGLARAHSDNDDLTDELYLLSEMRPATPALRDRIEDLIINVMKGGSADQDKELIVAMRTLKGLENKPLVISGKTVDGKEFSTADWKGKVVLVDFWATWCPPCLATLPRLEEVYGKFHGKGLEIVGVSNDFASEDLTRFLAVNKEMPWPQLFDPSAAAAHQWNSITRGFGILGVPTMFLIDRKGIVRSVEGEEGFEEIVPKLIAE